MFLVLMFSGYVVIYFLLWRLFRIGKKYKYVKGLSVEEMQHNVNMLTRLGKFNNLISYAIVLYTVIMIPLMVVSYQ